MIEIGLLGLIAFFLFLILRNIGVPAERIVRKLDDVKDAVRHFDDKFFARRARRPDSRDWWYDEPIRDDKIPSVMDDLGEIVAACNSNVYALRKETWRIRDAAKLNRYRATALCSVDDYSGPFHEITLGELEEIAKKCNSTQPTPNWAESARAVVEANKKVLAPALEASRRGKTVLHSWWRNPCGRHYFIVLDEGGDLLLREMDDGMYVILGKREAPLF